MSARSYRRRLPHWRREGVTYFVTWRLHRSQRDLSPEERTIVLDVLRYFVGARYRLHALVVMNDHVHVVVTPLAGRELGKILHTWKSFSAHRMQRETGRRGPLWQIDSYDRIIRCASDLVEKIRYIRKNPSRRWPGRSQYSWLWFVGMPNDDG